MTAVRRRERKKKDDCDVDEQTQFLGMSHFVGLVVFCVQSFFQARNVSSVWHILPQMTPLLRVIIPIVTPQQVVTP